MSEVLADTLPRATTATAGQPAFTAVLAALSAAAAWNSGESTLANAAAALPASTYALEDKLVSLTRKPDADAPASSKAGPSSSVPRSPTGASSTGAPSTGPSCRTSGRP